MTRNRVPRRNRQSPDIEELMLLAQSLAQSSSRLEDGFWEARLVLLINRHIASNDDDCLNTALDTLSKSNPRACDALADTIEFCCESRNPGTGSEHDVLLIAAPVLAWSRYAIPSGPISADNLANLRVQLTAHVLATDVRLGLADILFSPDQLPQGYADTAQFAGRLAKAALHGRNLHVDPTQLAETVNFLSDTRYLVGAIVAPKGAPLFRWQEGDRGDGERDTVLLDWRKQGGEALRPALPACAFELLLPLAFHAACRDADRLSRPYSIRASVAFLGSTVNIEAAGLCAVIALFQDNKLEEFRIGFVEPNSGNVIHGVVWPLLDATEYNTSNLPDNPDTPAQIEAVLRDCGINDVRLLEQIFPLEYCDDCGAPLYPNREGEPMHAELPEGNATQAPQHLH